MRQPLRAGQSKKKQFAWPWLGLYVVPKYQRQRGADAGTWLIQFHVPARLRPDDWPATINLPRAKPYCKGSDDLECVIRIKEDAAALYAALRDGRSSKDDSPPLTRIGSAIETAGKAKDVATIETARGEYLDYMQRVEITFV